MTEREIDHGGFIGAIPADMTERDLRIAVEVIHAEASKLSIELIDKMIKLGWPPEAYLANVAVMVANAVRNGVAESNGGREWALDVVMTRAKRLLAETPDETRQ
jgi:hypothetical protein